MPAQAPGWSGAWWVAAIALFLALTGPARAEEAPDPHVPAIVEVLAPTRLAVGTQGEIRLTYRARHANVVAVVRAIEDLGGPPLAWSTSAREFSVVSRAFGFAVGELTIPLSFTTPGAKRVTLTLVTDGREVSEPAVVEIEAVP